MIEDTDIRIDFQDPVDEPDFGNEDGETGEEGEDHGDIETLHSQISQISQICRAKSERGEGVSILPGSEQQGN